MTSSETVTTPRMRPYLTATGAFADGSDTPRAFLERCLAGIDAWEPRVGAFVSLNVDGARAAADRATERWRANRPLSPIDGMPLGIKDIIETADMPTECGSPLFAGWQTHRDAASVYALREAGAVILGKTVTTEFASAVPAGTRNPHDLARTPGGSSSGSAAGVAAGMISAALGSQVIGSTIRPASYSGCFGFKPSVGALNRGGSYDGLSQSSTGLLAATLAETWQVAFEIASRAGGDPGFPGLAGPATMPAAAKPRALALVETAAWPRVSAGARAALDGALARLKAAGIAVVSRHDHARLAGVEEAIAPCRERSMAICAWEARWPLNTYRTRDAARMSRPALDRLAQAEAMTLDQYRALLVERQNARVRHDGLAREVDACVTLSAPSAAPVGLTSTGDPTFTVPTSYLGVPAVSLPVLQDDGLPLGLQVIGFENRDADLMAVAAWIAALLAPPQA